MEGYECLSDEVLCGTGIGTTTQARIVLSKVGYYSLLGEAHSDVCEINLRLNFAEHSASYNFLLSQSLRPIFTTNDSILTHHP